MTWIDVAKYIFFGVVIIALVTALWSILHAWFKRQLINIPQWIIAAVLLFCFFKLVIADAKKDPDLYEAAGIGPDRVPVETLQRRTDEWRHYSDTLLKNGVRVVKDLGRDSVPIDKIQIPTTTLQKR